MSDFPTKQNPQPCKNGCGTRIYLSNKNGKKRWLPYELDDTVHDCPNKSNSNPNPKPSPGLDKYPSTTATTATATTSEAQTEAEADIISTNEQKGPTLEQLKIWIARLEKNGIHIDINEILNPKQDKVEDKK